MKKPKRKIQSIYNRNEGIRVGESEGKRKTGRGEGEIGIGR